MGNIINPFVKYEIKKLNKLGDKYFEDGIENDYKKALEYYKLSANQNNDAAQNNLGYMYQNGLGVEKDYMKAIEYYQLSAEQNNAAAQNNLGHMYQNGLDVAKGTCGEKN